MSNMVNKIIQPTSDIRKLILIWTNQGGKMLLMSENFENMDTIGQ